jgi:hypothetical protein
MRKLIAIAAFVLVAGCGKRTLEDNLLDEYTKRKDQLCACENKNCAMGTKALADEVESRVRQDIKNPSKELEEKVEKIEKQINECARKFE